MVFHVTKRGYCSSRRAGEGCWERRPKEKKEVLEEVLEELSSRPRREEEAENEDGVEEVEAEAGEGAWRRDMLGRRSVDCCVTGSSAGVSSSSVESSSSPLSGSDIGASSSSVRGSWPGSSDSSCDDLILDPSSSFSW